MTKEQFAAAAVALALVVGVVVLQKDAPPALDMRGARLAKAADGSKAYLVDQKDGTKVLLDAAPCVRRRKGSAPGSCLFGGVDIGESNRFDRAVSSGPDCEPVACAVGSEDPDADETDVLDKVQRIEGAK